MRVKKVVRDIEAIRAALGHTNGSDDIEAVVRGLRKSTREAIGKHGLDHRYVNTQCIQIVPLVDEGEVVSLIVSYIVGEIKQ